MSDSRRSANSPTSAASIRGEIRRFLALGSANTILTMGAFYGLMFVVPASVAFTIVYASALAILSVLTPRFVFRSRLALGQTAALGTWYVAVYFAGLGMTQLLGDVLDFDRLVVTVGTVAVTSPLCFVGARLLARRSARRLELASRS